MDCIVHGVTKSPTRLSDFHFHFPLSLQIPFLSYRFPLSIIQIHRDEPYVTLLYSGGSASLGHS